ncbi:MAG: FtsX-like permease family protein [Bacteroidales bacterium]|nr:FtsX-like permease family protein [Bacteroidales bacterium]
MISGLGVAVVTAALIVILSVFNGFDDLIKKFYNSFDADIKIISNEQKTFIPQEGFLKFLYNSQEIENYSFVLEENAMLKYEGKQIIATLKGVDENYHNISGIDTMIKRGEYLLHESNIPLAIAGWGIAYNLQLDFERINQITIYLPSRTKMFSGNFQDATNNINTLRIYAAGAFATNQEEYDTKYLILPIKEVRKLLEYENEISSIEIKLKNNINSTEFIKETTTKFGNSLILMDRNLQHEDVYKILKSEKLMLFIILIFILIIASFNLIASLSMIIIDKRNDIEILKSMGTDDKMIKKIFFLDGFFINLIGITTGLVLGTIICILQIKFGLVSLGSDGAYIIQNYPVKLIFNDYIYVFFSVLTIGIITTIIPIKFLSKRNKN